MHPDAILRRPAWVDDDLFPFTSRFLEVDGHVVHYVDEGEGPTLLMLHGNPTWSFVYRDVIEELRGEFRCIALDYPGFGLSEAAAGYGFQPQDHAATVGRFVEQLDLRDVTLVVQDWGGPIGLSVAGRSPERIRRLVLANTWAWPVNGDLHFEVFSHLMGGVVGREVVRRLNLFVRVMIPAGHRRRDLSEAEMRHYREPMSTLARRSATAVLPRAIVAARPFLERVAAGLPALADRPALFIWGDADIAFRDKELRRWQAELPRHTTVVIPGGGHFVQSDAPAEFADAIRSWWPTVDDGRPCP